MKFKKTLRQKKLIVFDLDGTLAISKQPIDADMAELLRALLKGKMAAIISGGKYEQFQKQIISRFNPSAERLKKFFLFPTNATSFYRYADTWQKVYAWELELEQRQKIIAAIKQALSDIDYQPPLKLYGEPIEDRGTQVTFSAVGQQAPVAVKEAWNKNDIRPKIISAIKNRLSGFEVRSGGLTSIDITKKGIDKAYGLEQIDEHLNIPIKDMLFIGDAIYPGGNDHAVIRTGVEWIKVNSPEDTKKIIKFLLDF